MVLRIILLFILVVLTFGLLAPYIGIAPRTDANFLLTVTAATGTFAGIAFAIYGWYTAKELPNIIDAKVNERMKVLQSELSERTYKQQQALQKVIASYGVNDVDFKISLLEEAVRIDPTVYNAFNALGYAYLQKGDKLSAEECFTRDLEYHPDNYQSACDLVFLYTQEKEWLSALKWMKKATGIQPETWEYFNNDARLDDLRNQRSSEYLKIIESAKQRSNN